MSLSRLTSHESRGTRLSQGLKNRSGSVKVSMNLKPEAKGCKPVTETQGTSKLTGNITSLHVNGKPLS